MPKPISETYDLGSDAYGRRTLATFKAGAAGGKSGWEIVRHEANQRDEQERVSLLTDDQLFALGEIAAQRRARHG